MEVWAPAARRVELLTSAERVDLDPVGGGWFATDRVLPHGVDYGFSLDGSDPLPDPRSPWQPYGVLGSSRALDHATFRWTDQRWNGLHLASAVIYELHVGTFTPAGTFAGAVERLDDLVALGIDAIELMPVASFAGSHGWGYDGVDLFAPHEPYGGPDALKALVDAAHHRGLGVILDVVYNHLGPVGNVLSYYGPYFNHARPTQWGPAVNLDGPDSGDVRRFFIDNARHWFTRYHVDGLRLDATHALVDDSAIHFLEELQQETDAVAAAIGRPLALIAESDRNDPRLVTAVEAGGSGLAAAWSDDLHHAIHSALTSERDGYYVDFGRFGDIVRAFTEVYVVGGTYSKFRRRVHGRPVGSVPGSRFVVYDQNHDQIGNRATGERLGQLAGKRRAEIAAAIVLCSPNIPLLFQGEEWLASTPFLYFVDFDDRELATAVREGRRAEFAAFGWRPEAIPDPSAPETFLQSKLRWEERASGDHAEVLEWYRRLLELRRSRPDLTDGRRDRAAGDSNGDAGWIVLRRERTAVVINLSGTRQRVPVDGGGVPRLLLANDPLASAAPGGVDLPPESVAIVELPLAGRG